MPKLAVVTSNISPEKLSNQVVDILVVSVTKPNRLSAQLPAVVRNHIKVLLQNGDLAQKAPSNALVLNPTGIKAKRLLVHLTREDTKPHQRQLDFLGVFEALERTGSARVSWLLEEAGKDGQNLVRNAVRDLVQMAHYHDYRYTETKKNKPAPMKRLELLRLQPQKSSKRLPAIQPSVKLGAAIGHGRNTMRHLAELPGNICTPEYLSRQARVLARKHGSLTTKVLGEREMRKLGMNALLHVGLGSDCQSQLIEMRHAGAASGKGKKQEPVVLVGKGITFDTGGISLKPGSKMDEMKFDMSGAAAVFGTMEALAQMQCPVPVIGLVAAAENMPDARAGRPGDVVTTMSGKTVEILNTDAEGRLVLCDALTYAKRYKPRAVVDMATLTGACVVALGTVVTALYANDETLAGQLLNAGESSGDRAWRMPLYSEYKKQLASHYADLANIGGMPAGSVTAACFLQEFADYPWAHLDIAGTAWPDLRGRKRSSGRTVPLLLDYINSLA